MIASGMSLKILKEALKQQKEVLEESKVPNATKNAFVVAEEEQSKRRVGGEAEEDDFDDFGAFSDTQSQFRAYEEEINEDDERLLDAFLSKDAGPELTLADLSRKKNQRN